jgi:signal transduction histidine kinase
MERAELDAERLKRDFVAMISHELRTPLTTLTGFSELLAMRADSLEPKLVAEFGLRMWRASRWLSRMIGDLLDLSQLEQGALALDIGLTDVTQILDDVSAIDVADRRPMSRIAEPGLPPVVADPARLRQVLGNLLSNARKFSPPGSPIIIEASRRLDRVEISVQDHGRGIAPEQLGRIFEPFVQTDPATTRETGGLGTGLYLVKQLCDRMSAEVRVESKEGSWSRFTVSLLAAGPLEATA